MKKKQRQEAPRKASDSELEAPPAGHSWDDSDHVFFARGEALENGDAPHAEHEVVYHDEAHRGWRARLSLPRAALLSLGLLLVVGVWLLGH